MGNRKKHQPIVLSIAGHDPSGGAGIQADLESIHHTNCHGISVITTLTTQNTQRFSAAYPQPSAIFEEQLITLLKDIKINACKIGLVCSLEIAKIITKHLQPLNIPVVFDPIFKAGSGEKIMPPDTYRKVVHYLSKCTTLMTPNSLEMKILGQDSNMLQTFIQQGIAVLVTDTHLNAKDIQHQLYLTDKKTMTYQYPRLSQRFHGSGCTLSASIAAWLAIGLDLQTAVKKALDYTWKTLEQGVQIGLGRYHPQRVQQAK